jgi:hypothetical protein
LALIQLARTVLLQFTMTSNQALQPTPSRLVSFFFMIKLFPEIASHSLARRG